MKNIGEHMREVEEREVRRATRKLKPQLTEAVSNLKEVFELKRYRKLIIQEWTPQAARHARSSLRASQAWRAFVTDDISAINSNIAKSVAFALQSGLRGTIDHVTTTLDVVNGMGLDWEATRKSLQVVREIEVEGMTRKELAKSITNALVRSLDLALRRAVIRQKNIMAVRSDFNRRADQAVQSALSSLARIVGDAVTDGQRYALSALENPRLRIAA